MAIDKIITSVETKGTISMCLREKGQGMISANEDMTASKFKKGRRTETTGSSLEEIRQDNIEAAKKQQSKNKKRSNYYLNS